MTEPISVEEDDKKSPELQRLVEPVSAEAAAAICNNRKEKRKLTKKEKRKRKRKELAEKVRQEEEAKLNDPEELRRIQMEEEKEKERLERDRREFEERERLFLEALARKKAQEEEEEERRRVEYEEEKANQNQKVALEDESDGDDKWEYVEDGPPEIIWQGNEIIVKRNKVKVKRKDPDPVILKEDPNRPTSNPLPPQSELYADYKNASSLSAQQLLENVAVQTPNFGTEQDKAHCPFHLKTGACRFGSRCSRVHFYPDKSCTLLMKNMYCGPGFAWEQDEGLEYTDEEVECSFEEFYEDVHTEFLKFGEIINFKVCRNSSSHLRGNVYVHYKDIDSAVLAYHSINGRYFAGKQITCEFVSVTKWKVAICGEFMKSKLKSCSRGTACNFIHCFHNPCGDYEWADLDKPPPRYWLTKMAALFGYADDSVYDRRLERENSERKLNSCNMRAADSDRHRSVMSDSRERRSRSRESRSSRIRNEDYDVHKRTHQERGDRTDRKRRKILYKKRYEEDTGRHEKETNRHGKSRYSSDSDWDLSDREKEGVRRRHSTRERSKKHHNEKMGRQHRNGDTKKGISCSKSGNDLLEKSRYGDAGSGNRERGSRHWKEDHSTDSGSEWLDETRDRNLPHRKRKSSSRRHNSVPSSPDHWDKRSRGRDSNTTVDLTAAITDKRKPISDKSVDSVDSDMDYHYHLKEDIEERGRWEHDEGATETHTKSSKKSIIDYSEDHNVESELNDNGDDSGSTRGISRSISQKRRGNRDRKDSAKKSKRSKE
ncbi:Zinc finger CCCH domain-containing protein 5 [Capsicum annuum]|uniref:zinc finger CCCH domain-containing protein 5 n=1 Tax=Capsicum annuum TaxID=4072 RepID=UPI001FB0571D|nr:zinc finger CCCH domain-containing protein 5 [Capsicum annuum]KAF3659610.1 Zinc finger CCCH domain-containing protein 5 [Capsicum annuum]KAF3675698.1 Zinc finger CCCH domain-containing protein 5 [Capsicum annuum]